MTEQSTMGRFLAALRKEKGLTQQQTAEKLGVSNKAVSRWERDETAPDISLLPEIAALFGVSCDELLGGGRIFKSRDQDNNVQKEQSLHKQAMSRLTVAVMTAAALDTAGIILLFLAAYGLESPLVGLGLSLLMAVAGILLTALACSRLSESSKEQGEPDERFRRKELRLILTAAAFTVSAAVSGIPLAIFGKPPLPFVGYLSRLPLLGLTVLWVCVIVYLFCRRRFFGDWEYWQQNALQTVFSILVPAAGILTGWRSVGGSVLWLILLLSGVVLPVIWYAWRNRRNCGRIIACGVRNAVLTASALSGLGSFSAVSRYHAGGGLIETEIIYRAEPAVIGLLLLAGTVTGYVLYHAHRETK